MPPKVCRFYNTPQGCRRGESCTFEHTGSSAPSPSPGSSPPNRGPGPASQRPQRPPPPQRVCKFWVGQGRCNYGNNCRDAHPDPSETRATAVDLVTPFLTDAGLAKVSGVGTDIFFDADISHTPGQAFFQLHKLLRDDFRFSAPSIIYSFLTCLSSANVSNTAWTSEQGQELLVKIASENGLSRIRDIVNWPTVSTAAGNSRTILSFQRGYVQLLKYLSSQFVVKSTLGQQTNALFLCILDNLDKFADVMETSMEKIMTAKSFRDPVFTAAKVPSGNQVFFSLTSLLYECVTRYKNAIQIYPRLGPLAVHTEQWIDTWIKSVEADPSSFDNSFKDLSRAVQGHVTGQLRLKIDRVMAIVKRDEDAAERKRTKSQRAAATQSAVKSATSEGLIAALRHTYEGPGIERPQGPRHDNDFVNIDDIRTAPTHEELVSRIPPYLPANLYDAPHPHAPDSMQRLLDVQFRLLREELTAPLRSSVQVVLDDLRVPGMKRTQLSALLEKKGGKYKGHADSQDSIMFNIYTDVIFNSLLPDRRGITETLTFDTPPGRARSPQSKVRAGFWEANSGKRLMQGGLVALVWKRGQDITVHLGTLATSVRDVVESSKTSPDRITVRVAFFDPEVEIRILHSVKQAIRPPGEIKLLVEAPVLFEAIRPFLEALRREPETVPFSRYLPLRPPGFYANFKVDPPVYATTPGFQYNLSSLFVDIDAHSDLRMSVSDSSSVDIARQALRDGSRLDDSQADSIVEALTREIAMIQGPPGTGKSYTGVELLRVLLANKIGPILMIAFTNHALDHMLASVLDAKITDNIVRLGSRSADERVSQYSIEAKEMVTSRSSLDRSFSQRHRALKNIENEIATHMRKLLKTSVDPEDIIGYLDLTQPEPYYPLVNPPAWIATLRSLTSQDDGENQWHNVGPRGRGNVQGNSIYEYWRHGRDLDFLRTPRPSTPPPVPKAAELSHPPHTNRFDILASSYVNDGHLLGDEDELELDSDDDEEQSLWMKSFLDEMADFGESHPQASHPNLAPAPVSNPFALIKESDDSDTKSHESTQNFLSVDYIRDVGAFFKAIGLDKAPEVPTGNRSLDLLLDADSPWSMSYVERDRLHAHWEATVRSASFTQGMDDFKRLRAQHAAAQESYDEGKNECRRQLLSQVDIIGCTTTGAAKLTALLKGISPRVMLVEEAGQVLEAHVLGSLVPSVEHLILIGDPLQLRPTIANYGLSVDSRKGEQLYKFDRSLMERLASSGMPMSLINVQRRMRPDISDLIRHTLYPQLIDHELVHHYPHVRGFEKNVFFFTHNHRENGGGEESASKFNMFEVDMIKDIVLYLLRQGCYSEDGDIVVLAAYLGQLSKLRDALSGQVTVVIDERDKAALEEQEDEREDDGTSFTNVEQVQISRRVRLRTIDNYQGEEAKIVILSLVRNSGAMDDEADVAAQGAARRGNIGFLKSENRTNVAVSRAKEGLIILGNAPNLSSRSRMWRSIIEELEAKEAVGDALPVSCPNHPGTVQYISSPGKLPRIAPDGGCLEPCGTRLQCGHLCPFKCHSDDPRHVAVQCTEYCRRLCPRGHPCNKPCATPCGDCRYPVSQVELPCGHIADGIPCHMLDSLDEVVCNVVVEKSLLRCEHSAAMRCSNDASSYNCMAPCGGIMTCCGRTCRATCNACQSKNTVGEDGRIVRAEHCQHNCQKALYCQHLCQNPCSRDHEHSKMCKAPCRQVCVHAKCRLPCSAPCAPCQGKCTWNCPHHTCPVPCGSVCARLPCDQRCKKILKCGHRCPSVCGEPCDIMKCPLCASPDDQSSVVDFIMQRTLAEVSPDEETLDELLITIPNCRHTFTVETLDGHCGMSDYYDREGTEGKWTQCKEPPFGFRAPPVCPTCRAAITCPRYGRIFKRADLDIIERNVASQMTLILDAVDAEVTKSSKVDAEATVKARASSLRISGSKVTPQTLKKTKKEREQLLRATRETPVPLDTIIPGKAHYHGVDNRVNEAWRQAINHLLRGYEMAWKVASTRSAHVSAWEAAFHTLHEQEMELSLEDPSTAPRQPQEHAMRMARIRIGQPQPRADKRFVVEAFWSTLAIRFTLADLAMTWLRSVSQKKEEYPTQQRTVWAIYIEFLLRSCTQDAEIALRIAQNSESRRQVTKTALYLMRSELELFKLDVEMSRERDVIAEARSSLVDKGEEKHAAAKVYARQVEDNHIRSRGSGPDDHDWLQENFSETAEVILQEWNLVLGSVRDSTFYQSVSLDEKMSIIRALNFSHTGHFYKCRNGHTFVIGECGGAMQRSFCPECGEGIGGDNHVLDSSNARSTEFEELVRRQGAQQSPWAWAR